MDSKGSGMTDYQQSYYTLMLTRDRLIPITVAGRMVGFITYFIGSDASKYVREDPWSAIDDNPDGSICFVDQLITNKDKENPKYSRTVLKSLIDIIRTKHPSVHVIRWNRHKRGETHVYYRAIGKQKIQQASV